MSLKHIFSVFTAEGSDSNKKRDLNRRLTNSKIIDMLETQFQAGIDQYSARRRMLYPMKFDVLLHPDDYNDVKDTLQFIIKEITDAFYDVIRKNCDQYKDYTPVADSWVFRFAPCELEDYEIEGQKISIERGNPMTIGKFFCEELGGANVRSEQNVSLSLCCNNSEVLSGKNINPELLNKVDVLAEGFFREKFDNSLGESGDRTSVFSKNEKSESKDSGSDENEKESRHINSDQKLATLSYSAAGMNYHYSMLDSTVKISGQEETQKRRDIFKIESPDISNGHIRIRTLDNGKSFQLAAFGPANLNGRTVPVSDASEVRWVNLANNSQIFINSSVAVKFSIAK